MKDLKIEGYPKTDVGGSWSGWTVGIVTSMFSSLFAYGHPGLWKTPVYAYPQSCEEYRAQNPGSTDGNKTLYVQRNATKAFTAYCYQMTTTPITYLNLSRTGGIVITNNQVTSGYNYSSCTKSPVVVTQFTKVAYDPISVAIDPADTTFSTTQGTADPNWCTIPRTYGRAADCTWTNSDTGRANVDLTGTGFGIASNTWAIAGWTPAGTATVTNSNIVTITGGGHCGWNSPGSRIYLSWSGN